ncbi:MAG: DUF485 domain-containing protein [Candidatus Binatia bacterium]
MARGRRPTASAQREADLQALARARMRVGFALTAAVVLIYFGFIAAVAFAAPVLGTLVVPGLSVGIVVGALVIVSAWLLTWVYVEWANRRYDPALRALRARGD